MPSQTGSSWMRLGAGAMVVGFLPLALAGCDSSAPAPIVVEEPAPTSEEQLDAIMSRFSEALEVARMPANSGVVSQRRSSYEVVSHEAGQPARVEVTVVRTVALDTGPDAINKQAQVAADPPVITEEEKFRLAYDDDRWRLLDEPESGVLDVCWDYALEGQ